MSQKFIIEDDQFKLGHVTLHRDLAKDVNNVPGGGYWAIRNGVLYLYSTSQDFGSLTIEQIREVKKEESVVKRDLLDMPWKFSKEELLFDAMENSVEV